MYKIYIYLIKYIPEKKSFLYQKKIIPSDRHKSRQNKSGFILSNNEEIIKELNILSFNNYSSLLITNFYLIVFFSIIFYVSLSKIFILIFFVFLIAFNFYKINKVLNAHLLLEYDLPEKKSLFNQFNEKLESLSFVQKIRQVKKINNNLNLNKFAGNKLYYQRKSIYLKKQYPAYLKSNLKIFSFLFEKITLSFFPDMLLLLFNNRYIAVPYNLLKINYAEKTYHEYKKVPTDAKIIGKIWLHPRKDGKPDKRYRKNYQVPIIIYAEITFIIANFLKFNLQISHLKSAKNFAKAMEGVCEKVVIEEFKQKKKKKKKEEKADKKYRSSKQEQKSYLKEEVVAFKILGIPPTSDQKEIQKAYRKLIKKHHPDLFTSRGEEFLKAAEERMKKINLAYERVNRP